MSTPRVTGAAKTPLFDRDPGVDPRKGDIYWHHRLRSTKIFVVDVSDEYVLYKYSAKGRVHTWPRQEWSQYFRCDSIIELGEAPEAAHMPPHHRPGLGKWVPRSE